MYSKNTISGIFWAMLVFWSIIVSGSASAGVPYHVPSPESGSCGPFLPKPSQQDLADLKKYFPRKKYRKFPAYLRGMFQRADFEHDTCRGLPYANASDGILKMQSCNRSQRAYFQLEKKGWCWGGSDKSSEQHWISCGSGPRNENPDERYPGDGFNAQDFRRALRELHPHGPLPKVCPI